MKSHIQALRPLALHFIAVLIAVGVIWANSGSRDVDVYRAALERFANGSAVLASKPSACHSDPAPSTAFKGIDPQLASSYLKENAVGAKPVSLSELRDLFAIANLDTLETYQKAGIATKAAMPNLVNLSRVGFNAKQTEALFCLEAHGSALVHLRLQDGVWRVASIYARSDL